MEESFRRKLIRLVTFLAGVYFFLEFLLPESVLERIGVADVHSDISTGFIVVGTMAFGLGIINLFRVHGTKVVFRRKDWFFSLALLAGLTVMMGVTAADWYSGLSVTEKNAEFRHLNLFTEVIIKDSQPEAKVKNVPKRAFRIGKLKEAAYKQTSGVQTRVGQLSQELPEKLSALQRGRFKTLIDEIGVQLAQVNPLMSSELSTDSELAQFGKQLAQIGVTYEKILRLDYDVSFVKQFYLFFFEGLFVSLGSAMFSLLGVYIASAAYRAFRIKSVESLLMMTAAIIVMLGQIPFYEYIWLELPNIRQWLLEVPNTAAFRAIKIGAAMAGLVMAFRMWFSIESESFSPREAKK